MRCIGAQYNMYKNITSNSNLTKNSQKLRNGMTKEERHIWYDFFKKLSVTVNRQKVIGKYIVDFYIASCKTAVEIDGSQHYDDNGVKNDEIRDAYLNSLGINVLRYSNADINQRFKSVCDDVLNKIKLLK